MTRIALLANPDSGSGDAGDVESLLRENGAEVSRFGLDQTGEAIAARPERIVVAGGDGSIGAAAEVAAGARLPLGVVAVGTANDFARSIGIPLEPPAAARIAVAGNRTRRLDLGRAGGQPFVNAASAGLSPVAARRARGLKGMLGPFAYTVGALRAGMTAKPVTCNVRCDDAEAFAGRAWQVIVAGTGAFGGGAEVDADPRDGLLDLVVIEESSRARLVAHAYGMRSGRVEDQRAVLTGEGRVIEVETEGEAGFNVDGELVEEPRLRFTVEPRAFEVVIG